MSANEKEIAELRCKTEKNEIEIANIKNRGNRLELCKFIITIFSLLLGIFVLITNFPNFEFGLSINSTSDKVDPGDVITNTIYVTNNKPITWWTGGIINKYPFPVTLNVRQPPPDILVTFIPDIELTAGSSCCIYFGVTPNATNEIYELEFEGIGSDGIKRTCTYQLSLQDRMIQDNRSTAVKWGTVGFTLLDDGYRCNDALPWFDNALKFDMNDFKNLEGKADCLAGLRKYAEAFKYANKSLSINSNENGNYKDNKTAALAYEIKGMALSNLGDSDKRQNDYKNATKKYKDAIKYLDKATYLNPNYYWALYWKGYTYSEMGNYSEAMDSFNDSINAAGNSYEFNHAKTAYAKAKELWREG